MVHPEYVQAGRCVVDDLGSEIHSVGTGVHVEGVLALLGPVFEIGARVDSEGVVGSESTVTERFVDPGALLGRHETVFNLAVLVTHRVVPVKALGFPLHDVSVVGVHQVAVNILTTFSIGDLNGLC